MTGQPPSSRLSTSSSATACCPSPGAGRPARQAPNPTIRTDPPATLVKLHRNACNQRAPRLFVIPETHGNREPAGQDGRCAMGLLDPESGSAVAPTLASVRVRTRPPRRFVSEFENEIRQLYVRMIDEPIPPRLIGVLRAGLSGHKR